MQFNNKRTRRLPYGALKFFAAIGGGMKSLGLPVPLEPGRLMRMTTNYPVPLENTFEVCGDPQVTLRQGVAETVEWMKTQA
jgi:hypothetical protein